MSLCSADRSRAVYVVFLQFAKAQTRVGSAAVNSSNEMNPVTHVLIKIVSL